MALIKCPECGKEVSDRAKQCIHCGCPLHEDEKPKQEEIKVQVETHNALGKCKYHPDRDAVGYCEVCGKTVLCKECYEIYAPHHICVDCAKAINTIDKKTLKKEIIIFGSLVVLFITSIILLACKLFAPGIVIFAISGVVPSLYYVIQGNKNNIKFQFMGWLPKIIAAIMLSPFMMVIFTIRVIKDIRGYRSCSNEIKLIDLFKHAANNPQEASENFKEILYNFLADDTKIADIVALDINKESYKISLKENDKKVKNVKFNGCSDYDEFGKELKSLLLNNDIHLKYSKEETIKNIDAMIERTKQKVGVTIGDKKSLKIKSIFTITLFAGIGFFTVSLITLIIQLITKCKISSILINVYAYFGAALAISSAIVLIVNRKKAKLAKNQLRNEIIFSLGGGLGVSALILFVLSVTNKESVGDPKSLPLLATCSAIIVVGIIAFLIFFIMEVSRRKKLK